MSESTASRWDDYLDVFIAPSRLFERRSDGKFGHAFLVFMVLLAALYFVGRTAMQPIMDAEFQRGMAQAMKANPTLTPDQLERFKGMSGIFVAAGLLIGMPIGLFILGGAVTLGAKLVGASLSYAQGTTIMVFAMFPRLLDSVAGTLQALLKDEATLTSRWSISVGPGRFLDPDTANATLLALVGRLDLFTLWVTVLVAIGVKAIAKASTAQAATVAAFVWLVGALPSLFQALRAA